MVGASEFGVTENSGQTKSLLRTIRIKGWDVMNDPRSSIFAQVTRTVLHSLQNVIVVFLFQDFF
jgi:hypothetical protein